MLETMRWVQWLEVEQRHLVWMRAKRYGWRDITIRFACDRTTAWRRWQRALQTSPINSKVAVAKRGQFRVMLAAFVLAVPLLAVSRPQPATKQPDRGSIQLSSGQR
jgi:hypothetical protein